MFRKMPFLLMAMMLFVGVLGDWIPLFYQSVFYAMSLTIKSFIISGLPFVIFGLLFKTTTQMTHQASKWILLVIALVCSSNLLSTLVSHFVGTFAYQLDLSLKTPIEQELLKPAWDFSFSSGIK